MPLVHVLEDSYVKALVRFLPIFPHFTSSLLCRFTHLRLKLSTRERDIWPSLNVAFSPFPLTPSAHSRAFATRSIFEKLARARARDSSATLSDSCYPIKYYALLIISYSTVRRRDRQTSRIELHLILFLPCFRPRKSSWQRSQLEEESISHFQVKSSEHETSAVTRSNVTNVTHSQCDENAISTMRKLDFCTGINPLVHDESEFVNS